MSKSFFQRLVPSEEAIKEHKYLRPLAKLMEDPYLFHLNRRSVSGAAALGMFMAWMPVPIQMWLAAVFAIIFRVNLPISVAMVWVTNPVTMPPMFYFAFLVGDAILPAQTSDFAFELSWQWFAEGFTLIWQPFLLGCLVVGVVTSLLAYLFTRLAWRITVTRRWRERADRMRTR